ncbi:MAG: ATPase [Alphaproteobacteria bacterium]|nr:ATPase [Alphaproteobacteria bacterium]
MRRFYKVVSVAREGDAFTVTLDGKKMRTRAKAPFHLPNEALARAIANEWEDQGSTIKPQSMPITRLAGTAIDRVSPARSRVIDELAAYGETDLLCHRADRPAELVTRQDTAWRPLLDWAAQKYSADLKVTIGILPQPQPKQALAALRGAVAGFDDMMLAGLHSATTASGSLIIGLALAEGRIDAAGAFEISQVDETFQIERWGEDAELEEQRAGIRADMESTAIFIRFLSDQGAKGG